MSDQNRPVYNVLMYHTDATKERPTEVGALWKRKDGKPGFMLTLKRGLSIGNPKGVRIVCLPVEDKRSSSRGRDDE